MERLRTAKRPAPDPQQIEVVDWEVVELLRLMSGMQRLELMDRVWEDARGLIERSVRAARPTLTEPEVLAAVSRRMRCDAA